VSIVRACKIIKLDRSLFYYQSVKDDSAVESKLMEYASGKLQNRGFPEYFKRIRREGLIWNHKRVERVYKKLGMNKRKKHKRRIPNPLKQPLAQPIYKNLTWSMDFMEDRLENGRKVRILNIIDDFNRQALLMEVDFSFCSERVVELVKRTIEWHGKPESIRTDNGTEFTANAFKKFCFKRLEHIRIQKGKPSQNGYIERFNGSYRSGVLDAYLFETRQELQQLTNEWMEDYNSNHPHESLGDRTPIEFARAINYGKLAPAQSTPSLPQLTA
jgi:putative transposase